VIFDFFDLEIYFRSFGLKMASNLKTTSTGQIFKQFCMYDIDVIFYHSVWSALPTPSYRATGRQRH